MKTFCDDDIKEYMKNDWILELLQKEEKIEEKNIRTNVWLREMENKRMIYAQVYGDILKSKTKRKVLDVGGGYNSLTKILARNSDYTLVDFLAHGGNEYVGKTFMDYNIKWIDGDWYDAVPDENYDIIIANDIFPDVDQRLELFIEKMLPNCGELRLVLTYYNMPKFYLTKRTDDTELMTFLSWDGEITGLKLKKYLDRIENTSSAELDDMKSNFSSIYRNRRQVSYIRLLGGRQI